MTAIIVLIVCSLIVALGFLFGFIWSVKRGQYDDTVTPSIRILFDDEVKIKDPDSEAGISKKNSSQEMNATTSNSNP